VICEGDPTTYDIRHDMNQSDWRGHHLEFFNVPVCVFDSDDMPASSRLYEGGSACGGPGSLILEALGRHKDVETVIQENCIPAYNAA
jgi:hypothetical protein